MDFIFATAAPSPAYDLSTYCRFKRRPSGTGAPLNMQDNLPQQIRDKEPYEAAIEDLRRSFDKVMEKLDRIEAKVDLLNNAIELPEQDSR